MNVDEYGIIGDPEGYAEIFVKQNSLPKTYFPAGQFRLITRALYIDPQGGEFAVQILSGINAEGYYRSKSHVSNRVIINENIKE